MKAFFSFIFIVLIFTSVGNPHESVESGPTLMAFNNQ